MRSRFFIVRIITQWSCSSNFRVVEFRIKSPAEFAFSSRHTLRTWPRSSVSWRTLATRSHSNAWCDYCPELGVRLPKICGMAEKTLDSVPVAAVAERGPGPTTPATEAAAAGDRGYSVGERLLKLSVSTRSKKMWEQLAQTLD